MFSSQNSQVSSVPNYIEDVFSTYLYTGNSSTQTITNGIDLSGEGGMIWRKSRSDISNNQIIDTNRGIASFLTTNTTDAASTGTNWIASFDSSGFTMNSNSFNGSPYTYASWTFRKQPKFFDVVTYTGNGSSSRTIAHSLGSVPGCIIVKGTSVSGCNWAVYHRSTGADKFLLLNTTDASASDFNTYWGGANPTSTNFSVGSATDVNQNGTTYVAYLFAHNAGGFGLTGTDNVISCGSLTTDSSGNGSVTLGYEPQWVLIKRTDDLSQWYLADNMRGMPVSGNGARLFPNLTNAESTSTSWVRPNATGFTLDPGMFAVATNLIYIAIRRGPMKVPTSGTSVFYPLARTGTGTTDNITGVGFAPDLVMAATRNQIAQKTEMDRLRGVSTYLTLSTTATETTSTNAITAFNNNGITVGADTSAGNYNYSTWQNVNWFFGRAPSFFDEVCYTTPGSTFQDVPHNLGVTPELIIVKRRNGVDNWGVQYVPFGSNSALYLNTTDAVGAGGWSYFFTSVTASSITVATSVSGYTAGTYVAYLFATCAGVSKVGSYTGTGTTKQVDCGFTGGARFVLIKRTDSTGDWYVWDTARGIVSGNDPYLLLNSTAAEVTSTDYIDTYSAGFEISSTAPAAINASGGTFIFLAIA